MKNKIILLLISSVLMSSLVIGCGKTEKNADTETKEQMAQETEQVKESEEAVELNQDELDEFTDLFDTAEYNGFLVTPYGTPEEIDWDEVLFNGANIAKEELTKSEKNAYVEAFGDDIYTDIIGIRADDIKAFMSDYAGVEFDPQKDLQGWTYVEKYDSYYAQHGDTNYQPFTCESGKKLGDEYVLEFSCDSMESDIYSYYPDRELTLEKTKNGYQIKSNVYLYEKNNDPEQTFDIELSWEDEACRFITYQGNLSDGVNASMIITKDGKKIDSLNTVFYTGNDIDLLNLININAVGVFDFNGDGLTDIVVVAECSDGQTHMALYQADLAVEGESECYFTCLDEASVWLEGFIDGDLTIPNIKAYLLGDNKTGIYSDWKEAYTQVAKIAECKSDTYFSLIYLDEDDIPELVVDRMGYNVSVYSFKDGVAAPLLTEWAYGAGGVAGYEYSSKNGCICLMDSDYAGLVDYNQYAFIHDGRMTFDYTEEIQLYDDLNGNGYPDEDESTDEALNNAKGSVSYSASDESLTESQIKAKIEEIRENFSFDYLTGEYEYTEFLDYLEQY